MNIPRLYVGSMNGACCVIDQPPRPNDDEIFAERTVTVFANCGTNFELASQLCQAWNALLDGLRL